MRLKLIACNVFQREACLALVRTPHVVDVTFIELGEHERPDGLRTLIQAQIDAASAAACPYDAILLLFGLCGNATVGLVARGVPLVIPRAHDCATILLGGREAFRRHFADNPSRAFGCSGYCERGNEHMLRAPGSVADTEQAEYVAYVQQYGEENAKFIWETMHPVRPDDGQSCYIRVPETDLAGLAARFRERAEANGRVYVEFTGSLRLIDALLRGDWEGGDFLRVAPGQTTVGRYDWDEVIAAT